MSEALGVPASTNLVQVDTARDAAVSLGPRVIAEFERAVAVIHRISAHGAPYELEGWADRFVDRFGDEFVPLLHALDDDVGVGLGARDDTAPVLSGISFRPRFRTRVQWDAREEFLLRRLTEVAGRGDQELVLDDADLDRLAQPVPAELPRAFAVAGALAATSAEAVDRGEFELRVTSVYGPSGVRLLGRFCHADPALDAAVRAHVRAEEATDPGAVYAEVNHLPEGRVGNVLQRPALRDYEIPILSGSGVDGDHVIGLDDLLVGVRDGRPVLWSRRFDKRVVPRLSNAHLFTARSLAVYRFLCLLQDPTGGGSLGWSWGALETAPFTPRVRYGRLVLALARWRISAGALPDPATVAQWREERGLPRFVAVARGDTTLPVDLDNPLCVDVLVAEVRHGGVIEEVWPEPARLCLTGPEGRYRHEVVVPFVCTDAAAPIIRGPSRVTAPIQRRFVPGSEWLYAKLYCSGSVADRLLVEVVAPLVAKVRADAAIDGWFFLRYADPDPHLRVRLHGTPDALRDGVLPALHDAVAELLDDGSVSRLVLDTYDREVDRYGGPLAMPVAERIFEADSDAVLALLSSLDARRCRRRRTVADRARRHRCAPRRQRARRRGGRRRTHLDA